MQNTITGTYGNCAISERNAKYRPLEACGITAKKHKILLVDDEESIIISLTRFFKHEGFDVLTALSGESGIRQLHHNEVSLVIADYRMPGMNGIEFLSHVRDRFPATIRFMLTGYPDDTVANALNRQIIERYLTKPWNNEELKNAVITTIIHYDFFKKNEAFMSVINPSLTP